MTVQFIPVIKKSFCGHLESASNGVGGHDEIDLGSVDCV